jgi:hypothetical protein
MAQYIEHPALLGARMADDLSKQRMNLVGQAISQSADALNRQAFADSQAVSDMMRATAYMRANRNPVTGVVEDKPVQAIGADWADPFFQEQMRRRATLGGYDPTLAPTSPQYRIGPNVTPAAGFPIYGAYGEGARLTPGQQIMQGRSTPTWQPNTINWNEMFNAQNNGMVLPAIGNPTKR